MNYVGGFPFYIMGRRFEKNSNFEKAEKAFRKAVSIHPKHPLWNARVAALLLRKKAYNEALFFYDTAVGIRPNRASFHFGRGKCLFNLKKYDAAISAFEIAIRLTDEKPAYYDWLANAYHLSGKFWQEIDALKKLIALGKSTPSIHYRLGEACEATYDFAQAASWYDLAVKFDGRNPLWHYRLGYALAKSGRQKDANLHYNKAAKLDKKFNSERFGEGVFHQARGYWAEAAEAYFNRSLASPFDAELRYKLGLALDRCYRFEEAEQAFAAALYLEPNVPYWHTRLGFTQGKLNKWDEAADSYRAAIALGRKASPALQYRLGYSLAKAQKWNEAAEAFVAIDPVRAKGPFGQEPSRPKSITDHFVNSLSSLLQRNQSAINIHIRCGELYERRSEFDKAAAAYQAAVDREENHNPRTYYILGLALYKAGRIRDACEAFLSYRKFQRETGVDTTRYANNVALQTVFEYAEYLQTLQIEEHTILYESYFGASINCNPFAIFEYIRKKHPQKYKHILVVDDFEKVPAYLAGFQDVVFVKRDSERYKRFLATAKYLVNNVTFPSYFIRRPEQIYLMTWHGTPLKALGKDMNVPGKVVEHRNVARNLLHATHLISPNTHTSRVLLDRYDVANSFTGALLECGYPRIDRMLNTTPEQKIALKSRLGLREDSPIVLYAPTWRGQPGSVTVDSSRLIGDLISLAKNEYQLLFRGHHLSEKALSMEAVPATVVPDHIDTNDLLSIVDVLITDYSSIFFDFLPSRKPIVFYAYDYDQYCSQRGSMYFDLHDIPGFFCETIEETTKCVLASLNGQNVLSDIYDRAIAQFCANEDGNATERAVQFMFGEKVVRLAKSRRKPKKSLSHKKTILFYAGDFNSNGINSSALNLLNSGIADNYQITVLVNPDAISTSEERVANFKKLPNNVQVLGSVGRQVVDVEEKWVIDSFNLQRSFPSPAFEAVYIKAFRREFERVLGHATWDVNIQFEGYSRIFNSIIAAAPSGRKVGFQHTDMQKEYEVRFPYLRTIFEIYRFMDTLISVSPTVMQINKSKLANLYGLRTDAFNYCTNIIDGDNIISLAKKPLDETISSWIRSRKTFVSLGRLSPEKDYSKLVSAFKIIHSSNPETCLVIAGDGPLKSELIAQINMGNLSNSILLPGTLSNPFPLLKAADCFVLSSNHEGQPMVLLEAMVLGKNIVATNIDGSRGTLGKNRGLIVENSVSGLVHGMNEYLNGNIPISYFDYTSYNIECKRLFDDVASK